MSDSGELVPYEVASLVLKALPGVSVIVFTREQSIAYASGRDLARDGLDAGIEGRTVGEVLAAKGWEGHEPLFAGALEGLSASIEIEATEDGRWYQLDLEPLRDAGGQIVAAACFLRDITEHKQLIADLRQRGQLMDLAHEAIIVREPGTFVVTYWNREATEIYGYSAGEARGRVMHDLLATEFPHSRDTIEEALLSHGRWAGELGQVRADGRRIVVSSRHALLRDERGEPLAVIELNSDVTERKRVERALRAAEEHFRELLESAPDPMVILDEHGAIALANARAEELFGYRQPELIGQPLETLLPEGLTERDVIPPKSFVAERAREDAGMDLLARRKDGTEFAAEVSLGQLRTESGVLTSAAVRDASRSLLRQLERALVPRMVVSDRWQCAWRYRPSMTTMLLGGDFVGVCERPDGSLSLAIGDVTGHGPAAAGTGAMLRSAWLGATLSGVPMRSLPRLLQRLLVSQADRDASTLASVCLAEIEPSAHELRLIRAGHDRPLLITTDTITAVEGPHGPVLGLSRRSEWPLQKVTLPGDAAIMLFTDGLTERRLTPGSARLGFDDLQSGIDGHQILHAPPGDALDAMLAALFPSGTEDHDDDLAVILLNLVRRREEEDRLPVGSTAEGAEAPAYD